MKNAGLGDTRNKLDDNSHLKQRRNNSKKTFKSLKDELSDNKPSITKSKKLTKGQIFKQTHGFSRSIARAMKKQSLNLTLTSFELYKRVRLNKKKVAKKIAQAKRSDSVAIRKYGKDTTKKSNKKKG